MVPHCVLDLGAVASITIKNIPDRLLTQLRERAAVENRSMNREIIRLLETSLSADRIRPLEYRRTLADMQAQAWSRLAGRWVSDVPIEDEIAGIYATRTAGREIALARGASVVTGNRKHYERIEGLRTEDWIRG